MLFSNISVIWRFFCFIYSKSVIDRCHGYLVVVFRSWMEKSKIRVHALGPCTRCGYLLHTESGPTYITTSQIVSLQPPFTNRLCTRKWHFKIVKSLFSFWIIYLRFCLGFCTLFDSWVVVCKESLKTSWALTQNELGPHSKPA